MSAIISDIDTAKVYVQFSVPKITQNLNISARMKRSTSKVFEPVQ